MKIVRLSVLLAALSCASPDAGGLLPPTTQVIAHRGGTGPDGTIAGCRRTLAMGLRFMELDVRLTKDGQAVILHDPTVDRTTDGKGPVSGMTLEELQRLDAGSRFDPAYAGERIPTVAALLRAVGSKGIVLLELKVPQAAGPVIEAIRQERAFDRAVVRTADAEILTTIRKNEPRTVTGTMGALPAEADLEAFISRLQDLGVGYLTPKQDERVSRSTVRRLQKAGIAVWGTNTNDEEVMRKLIDAGVDGIITDRPELLQSILRTGSRPRRS
jgi:glycerophosphoryl diester phosphodiesterase